MPMMTAAANPNSMGRSVYHDASAYDGARLTSSARISDGAGRT